MNQRAGIGIPVEADSNMVARVQRSGVRQLSAIKSKMNYIAAQQDSENGVLYR
jgi:hypothetical protein